MHEYFNHRVMSMYYIITTVYQTAAHVLIIWLLLLSNRQGLVQFDWAYNNAEGPIVEVVE